MSDPAAIKKLGIALPASIINDNDISMLFSFGYILIILLLPSCASFWWLRQQVTTKSGLHVITIHQLFIQTALKSDIVMDRFSILKMIYECSENITGMDTDQSLILMNKMVKRHPIFSFLQDETLDAGSNSSVFFLMSNILTIVNLQSFDDQG